MISLFRHKGLRRFHEENDISGIRTDQAERLRRLLSLLYQIQTPQEANLPGGCAYMRLKATCAVSGL